MTEAEWMASDDPAAMVVALRKQDDRAGRGHDISDRKLRLWIAACREAVERARPNNYAWHNLGSSDELQSVLQWWVGAGVAEDAPAYVDYLSLAARCHLLREIVGNPFRPVTLTRTVECDRCNGKGQRTVGSKCGSCEGTGKTKGNADWLTPEVLSLARAACDERREDGTLDPVRLAILADALAEAGCPAVPCPECGGAERIWVDYSPVDPHWNGCHDCDVGLDRLSLLGHLRSPGPHVRGCWVIDLLTGRE